MRLRVVTTPSSLRARQAVVDIGGVTHVMGVINLSPESANRRTFAADADTALGMARGYRDAGASIIDLGAQSSRFDVPTLAIDAEIERLCPAVEALSGEGFVVSVDTWKPEVAEAALSAGAHIVNDTGGLRDGHMRRVVRDSGAAAVVVYVEGANPQEVGEIDLSPDKAVLTAARLAPRVEELASEGLGRLIVDPGIAINYRGDYEAYTRLQLDVIRGSAALRELGHPVLIPIPRKAEDHRVAAYIALALEYGADLIRVHDVEMASDLVRLYGRTAPPPTVH